MMNISIALPVGRLFDDTADFLEILGIQVKSPASRELISSTDGYTFYFPRVFDIPVYVENGVDLGICGSDVVLERGNEVYMPTDLPFGKCRMSLIVPKGRKISLEEMEGYKIGSKYPEITKSFFSNVGIRVKTLKLNGAVELAAKAGIVDAIVDIVDTGNTLRVNDLEELHKIKDISAVLIVNRISQKTKFAFVNELVNRIKKLKRELSAKDRRGREQ